MRHGLLALAVLLGGSATFVHAEYVRFFYNPGVVKAVDPKQQPGVPGQPVFQPGQQPRFPGQNPRQPGGPGPGFVPGQAVPGQGLPGMQQQDNDDLDLTAVREIIVEVRSVQPIAAFGTYLINHKYGKTVLIKTDQIRWEQVKDNGVGLDTVGLRYKKRRLAAVMQFGADKPKPAKTLIELAEFAFTHGLYQQFNDDMEELAKTHPEDAQAKAYVALKAKLKEPIRQEPELLAWKDRLHGFQMERSMHYGLLYKLSGNQVEARQRVGEFSSRLESNYALFYQWFAFKGLEMAQPKHRLVVILVDDRDDFRDLHKAFDEPPLAADGFFSRRDGVAVMSMRPLDTAYSTLEHSTQDLWRNGWNKETLLKGGGKQGEQPAVMAEAQEKALLLKVMEDESLTETVSQVGSQQLATAIGLLPKAVASPAWLQAGIGSFFETPKGAYWQGTAAPHWNYLIQYHIWNKFNKLDKPEVALRRLITDDYYREALLSGKKEDMLKARALAWSFIYYLSHDRNRRPEFLNYLAELGKLPRDLEFDEQVLLQTFAKAFKCADPRDPRKIDEAEFRRIADLWAKFIGDTQVEVLEAWTMALKRETQEEKKKELRFQPGFDPNNPNNPALPGGPGVNPGIRPGLPGRPPGNINPES